MHDRLKLPLSFSSADLTRDMAKLEESSWINHFVTSNYEGNWSALALRMPVGAVGMAPVASLFSHWDEEGWTDAPLLKQLPAFQRVLQTFECPLYAVRLMRLTIGSDIKEHRDPDLSFEDGSVRLHVPVQTNSEVAFYLNNTRVIMHEGECWYLRLADPHRVSNRGTCDRIHLVIDAQVTPWLEALFRQAESAEPGSL